MDQTLHETGKPEASGKDELRVKTDDRSRKSKRKAKRGLRLNAWNFMLLLVAVQSTQIGVGCVPNSPDCGTTLPV